MATLLLSPAWPNAMMMPAMMKAARNWSRPPPMPATKPSAIFARSPIFGCRLWISAGRSVDAADQSACSFSPTTGHVATASGGAGISSAFSCTSMIN